MTCRFDDRGPGADADDEQIEAIRIRLQTASDTTAVVTEFRAADRVLAGWLAGARYGAQFHFQVTFCDGFVFCGCYQRRKPMRSNPSLSRYVRAALDALTAAQPAWLPNLARYSVES